MFWITGATGLVGSHVLVELLKKGEPIVAFYHHQLPESIAHFLQFKQMSPFQHLITWRSMQEWDWSEEPVQCEGLFHCAALVSYHAKDHRAMNEVNVEGTAHWVNWALEFNVPICHVSSIAALGKSEHGNEVDEHCFWQPSKEHTEYARTKFLSEMEVWRGIEEGLSAVMVNPGVVIGPCLPHQSSGKIFQTVARGFNAYPLGGTGFVAAQDVARAMVSLMDQKKWGERYVMVGENGSMKEVFQKIAKQLKISIPQRPVSPTLLTALRWLDTIKEWCTGKRAVITEETIRNTSKHTSYNSEKIKQSLNFHFTPLDEAIAETVEYMRPFLPLRP